MATPLAKQIVLAARPKGQPTAADFRLEETPIPTLPAGGLLLRVLYLSLDPYMRGRMDDAKSYAKSLDVGDRHDQRQDASKLPKISSDLTARAMRRAISCWRIPAGARMPPGAGRRSASSTPRRRRSPPGSACWECRASPPMRASISSASPSRARRWSLRRRAVRSARWSANSPRWSARGQSVSPAAPISAATSSRSWALTPPLTIVPATLPTSSRLRAQRASTSILRMSAAPFGRRFCRYSTALRACRSAD